MLKSVSTLPFNHHVSMQQSSTDESPLELPAGEQFLNHVGIVQAMTHTTEQELTIGGTFGELLG